MPSSSSVNTLASQRGRIGGYALAARYDSRQTTAKARATFAARWTAEVDPQGVLPVAERERRAEAARSAFYTSLAYKSAVARRRVGAAS